MKLIKKIFNSILVLCGIVLMVVLFCFAIMMLFHVSMFGYTYVKYEKREELTYCVEEGVSDYNLENLNLTTVRVPVIIMKSSDKGLKNVQVTMYSDICGICKDNVKKISVSADQSHNGKWDLTLTTNEPNGLILSNNSRMRIVLPQTWDIGNLSLNTSAKDFQLDDSLGEINVGKLALTFNAKNDTIKLSDKVYISEELSLNTDAGRILVNSNVNGNVKINSNYGTVIFNKSVNGEVDIQGDNPNVEFGDLDKGKIESIKAGKTVSLNQVNISGNVLIHDTNGGLVKVSGCISGDVDMDSPLSDLTAYTINGDILGSGSRIQVLGSLGSIGKNGNIQIGGNCTNLYINNCKYDSLTVDSNAGDIEIANAYGDVTVTNKRGDTKIGFVDSDVSNHSKKAKVISEEIGNIRITNISDTIDLSQAGKDSVYLEFASIKGENIIKSHNNITIKVKKSADSYGINLKAKEGNVDVEQGSCVYKSWDDERISSDGNGWKVISDVVNPVYDDDSYDGMANKLNVTIDGRYTLKLLDLEN